MMAQSEMPAVESQTQNTKPAASANDPPDNFNTDLRMINS